MTNDIRLLAENDPLVIRSRKQAREKIANAMREDGTFDWSKLPNLITTNTKLDKVADEHKSTSFDEIMIMGFQGVPHWISGYNTCAGASLQCARECIVFSGHGQRFMIHNGRHNVLIARIARTLIMKEHREQFNARFIKEVQAKIRKARKLSVGIALRPNVFTDEPFHIHMPQLWDLDLDYIYDYTKILKASKLTMHALGTYHITLSRNENTKQTDMIRAINCGINVTLVIDLQDGEAFPDTWTFDDGYESVTVPTIDGDKSDHRFLDPQGVAVLLKLKRSGNVDGDDTSGFATRLVA
jgi:hypothetical protein